MVFNSLQFILFFIIVYGLYLLLEHKWQNRMLLVASYVFYSVWDWRFSFLLLFITVINYYSGLMIDGASDAKKRKTILLLCVIVNLCVLGFFKYFNFFTANFFRLFNLIGAPWRFQSLNIILPLGISFYILQALSYTIDVYRKGMKPTSDFVGFALFVSFFPQLVAGPIERARNLLPQVLSKRVVTLDGFYEGCFLFLWGLLLKIFIADNVADIVTSVFSIGPPYNGLKVLLAAYAFTFQIYCDFEGYSSMARGLAKMMGFDIMLNFNLPYFITNVQEFWNRWHISLSSWVRDYIYMPLFFSIKMVHPGFRISIVTLTTMAIMGLWHGASWIFVAWGIYHGILLVVYAFLKSNYKDWIKPRSRFGEKAWFGFRMFFVFHLIVFGMLIFRAEWGRQLIYMTQALIFNFRWFEGAGSIISQIMGYTWILVLVQVLQYVKKDLLVIFKSRTLVKACFYFVCFILIIFYGDYGADEFIYFQF